MLVALEDLHELGDQAELTGVGQGRLATGELGLERGEDPGRQVRVEIGDQPGHVREPGAVAEGGAALEVDQQECEVCGRGLQGQTGDEGAQELGLARAGGAQRDRQTGAGPPAGRLLRRARPGAEGAERWGARRQGRAAPLLPHALPTPQGSKSPGQAARPPGAEGGRPEGQIRPTRHLQDGQAGPGHLDPGGARWSARQVIDEDQVLPPAHGDAVRAPARGIGLREPGQQVPALARWPVRVDHQRPGGRWVCRGELQQDRPRETVPGLAIAGDDESAVQG